MRDTYTSPVNLEDTINTFSDYQIIEPPKYNKKQSIVQKIKEDISSDCDHGKGILYSLPDNPDDLILPQPLYVV